MNVAGQIILASPYHNEQALHSPSHRCNTFFWDSRLSKRWIWRLGYYYLGYDIVYYGTYQSFNFQQWGCEWMMPRKRSQHVLTNFGKYLPHGSTSHPESGYRRVPSLLHCYPAWVEKGLFAMGLGSINFYLKKCLRGFVFPDLTLKKPEWRRWERKVV